MAEAAALLEELDKRQASVRESKRIISAAKQRLREDAAERERLIAQLEQLGIRVELRRREE